MPEVFGSIEQITLIGYLLRTLLVCGIGFLVGRLVSKRAVNQLTTYDFALIWILGAITVSPLLDGKVSFTYMIVPLLTLFFWHTFFSFISLKNRRFSFFFNGKPSILIDDGKVVLRNLKRHFINVELLLSELRVNNVFDVSKVKFAILEPNGRISIMEYEKEGPVTRTDMNLPTKKTDIPLIVINEGKIVYDNLSNAGVDETWLLEQLSAQKISDPSKVLLSTLDRSKKLFVLKMDK